MKLHSLKSGPCRPMRPFLDAAADRRSRGFTTWYAEIHAKRCTGCGQYLESLREISTNLAEAARKEDDPEALARLDRRIGL